MIKKILMGIAVVFIGLSIFIAARPSDFRITRTAVINAPVERVFTHINNFHNWEPWSPWAKLDPNAKNTFEGPAAGIGSIFKWAGNEQIGEGAQTIIESRANEFIKIKLDFLKPFQATNTTEFTFTPQGQQTVVTWSMYGKNNFVSKAVGLFLNCDKMVGEQFEKGLAQLNAYLSNQR